MADIIKMLEEEEIARLGKKVPNFAPGDTVVVGVNVVEVRVNVCRLTKAWSLQSVTVA
jgi:ribosomal protein L19